VTVHTITSLRKNRRRVVSRLEKADHVLREMAAGNSLYLMHTRDGPVWRLGNGKHVSNSDAGLVVASGSVVGVGDCLFRDAALSQTWRWWRDAQ
jgi:hypothetical protein